MVVAERYFVHVCYQRYPLTLQNRGISDSCPLNLHAACFQNLGGSRLKDFKDIKILECLPSSGTFGSECVEANHTFKRFPTVLRTFLHNVCARCLHIDETYLHKEEVLGDPALLCLQNRSIFRY